LAEGTVAASLVDAVGQGYAVVPASVGADSAFGLFFEPLGRPGLRLRGRPGLGPGFRPGLRPGLGPGFRPLRRLTGFSVPPSTVPPNLAARKSVVADATASATLSLIIEPRFATNASKIAATDLTPLLFPLGMSSPPFLERVKSDFVLNGYHRPQKHSTEI
jgi:hypothetical protein